MPAHLKYPRLPGETKIQRKARLKRERRHRDPEFKARCHAASWKSYQKLRLETPEHMKLLRKKAWEKSKDRPGFRERRKNDSLKRNYGITLEEFNRMSAEQESRCAICGSVPWRLVVDHCHVSGVVRKLLCDTCNSAIGLLRENPNLMRMAANYVEEQNVRIARENNK
jgi:Recombination endonuclease VII